MSRDFHISGECLVSVKGRADSTIAGITQLGLTQDPIIVTPRLKHEDINVDAWRGAPAEIQAFLQEVVISMNLIHYDRDILRVCMALAAGQDGADGVLARAGTRMGGNVARFAAGNNFIGLNITSPIDNLPWRFYYTYIMDSWTYPLGTQKSVVQLRWRAVPYTQDPWNGGAGALGYILYDHTLDS